MGATDLPAQAPPAQPVLPPPSAEAQLPPVEEQLPQAPVLNPVPQHMQDPMPMGLGAVPVGASAPKEGANDAQDNTVLMAEIRRLREQLQATQRDDNTLLNTLLAPPAPAPAPVIHNMPAPVAAAPVPPVVADAEPAAAMEQPANGIPAATTKTIVFSYASGGRTAKGNLSSFPKIITPRHLQENDETFTKLEAISSRFMKGLGCRAVGDRPFRNFIGGSQEITLGNNKETITVLAPGVDLNYIFSTGDAAKGQQGHLEEYLAALTAHAEMVTYEKHNQGEWCLPVLKMKGVQMPTRPGKKLQVAVSIWGANEGSDLWLGDILEVSGIKTARQSLKCTNGVADVIYQKSKRGYQITSEATVSALKAELEAKFAAWKNIQFEVEI